MSAKKIGVIYSLAQLVRRELIITENIDPHVARMQNGEGWLDIPLDVYESFQDAHGIDDYIAGILGEPTSDKCAVINGDEIVAVVCADPVIDQHPDGWIIQDDAAQTGWTYDFVNAVAVDPNPPVVEEIVPNPDEAVMS